MNVRKEQFVLHVLISFFSLFLGLSIFTFYILAFLYQKEWVSSLLLNSSLLLTAILQFTSSIFLILTGFSFLFSWKSLSKFNEKILRKMRENFEEEFKRKRKIILVFLLFIGIISIPLYFLGAIAYFAIFLFLTLLFLYILL